MKHALFSVLFFGLVYLFPHPLIAQFQPQFVTVDGYVLNDETDEPIEGANVFIASSLLGASTNVEGYFLISGVPLGTHDLVASFIGYSGQSETIRLTESETRTITLRLKPRIYESSGIEVVAERSEEDARRQKEADKERKQHLEKFRKFFLGISRNAEKCTIVNPEVLDFFVNEEEELFRANANDALVIDNRALGYRVRFVLEEFEVREKRQQRYIKYSGRAGFTELTTESRRENRRWTRNRERAYRGSQRHFLAALTADQLWEEGFMLVKEGVEQADYSGVPGARPSQRVIGVEPEEVLEEAELPFERVFEFDGYLKIIYMKGIPDAQYLEYKDYVAGWKLRDDEEQQASWIALTQGPVTITTDGKVNGKYGLTKLGYWFFDRVAEMLPAEYHPEGGLLASQQEGAIAANVSPAKAFQQGLRFIEADELDKAISELQPAFAVDPGFSLNGQGSVAYWLGEAFERSNRKLDAQYTWAKGMEALVARNQLDVRLADAYIRDVFSREQVNAYEGAVQSYLQILEQLDMGLPPDEHEVAHRHIAQMIFLLPEEIRETVLTRQIRGYLQELPLEKQAGAIAASWWRAEDTFPGTSVNERIVEHLKRVYIAEEQFTEPSSPLGFDDRGQVFVQFGTPRTRSVIKTDLLESRKVLQAHAVPLPGPLVVAPNEFWAYQHVDERLHFIFLMRGGRYQISSPEDLIPDDLRTASKRIGQRQITAGSTRINRVNEAYAKALIAAWQTIYSDLALHHPKFNEQVDELAMYEADLRATGGIEINASASPDAASGGGGISAMSYSSGLESRFSNLAHVSRVEREEQAPREHSRLLENVEPLPVAVRAARFLNDDGSTRTEVYWSHIPGTFAFSRRQRKQVEDVLGQIPDRYLIEMNIVQHRSDFSRDATTTIRYAAADMPIGSPAPVQSFDVDATEPAYHLSMQWGQYHLKEDLETGEVSRGEEFKLGIQRVNELRTLNNDEAALEVSDLKPIYLNDDGGVFFAEGDSTQAPAAYPFSTVTPETSLGLYFEVYHLAFGSDDQAQFTVEYEVVRDADRRGGRKLTSASTPYTSGSRTAKEFIAVDLSDYGDKGTLDIRVTVTDDVTSQEVSRTVRFNLAKARTR